MSNPFQTLANPSRRPRQLVDQKRQFFFGKRVFDIIVSSLVVVFVLSWLFPLVAVLIRLESKGPLFFVQKRVGHAGRTFLCLKFRTMKVNANANLDSAVTNDIRITRVGKFLRLSNLDEFPQFFNVLTGDMSIVGPRPHMHADCTRFSELIKFYKFRNLVRPGITGLAQVKGMRGPTKTSGCILHRYRYDAFYVKNANMLMDLRIVQVTAVQTAGAIFARSFSLLGLLRTSFQQSLPHGVSTPFLQRKWVMVIRSIIN